jgi:hypothetical protein
LSSCSRLSFICTLICCVMLNGPETTAAQAPHQPDIASQLLASPVATARAGEASDRSVARRVGPNVGEADGSDTNTVDPEVKSFFENLVGNMKKKMPKIQHAHIQKTATDLKNNIAKHLKTKDRSDKLEKDLLIIRSGRTPTGSAPHKIPYEHEFSDTPWSDQEDEIKLTIPPGTTIRQVRSMMYFKNLETCKQADFNIEKKKLDMLKPSISYKDFINHCTICPTDRDEFKDMGLDIPEDLFENANMEHEMVELARALYKQILENIAVDRKKESVRIEKLAKNREAIEAQAGNLKPEEVLTGAVRQVLREDKVVVQSAGKGGGGYEINYVAKMTDRLEGTINPNAAYVREAMPKRRYSKAELAALKKSKNGLSLGETQGTIKTETVTAKTKPVSKGKGKGKKGKGKGVEIKPKGGGKGKPQKGKGKGKSGKPDGKNPSQNGKGKGGNQRWY